MKQELKRTHIKRMRWRCMREVLVQKLKIKKKKKSKNSLSPRYKWSKENGKRSLRRQSLPYFTMFRYLGLIFPKSNQKLMMSRRIFIISGKCYIKEHIISQRVNKPLDFSMESVTITQMPTLHAPLFVHHVMTLASFEHWPFNIPRAVSLK